MSSLRTKTKAVSELELRELLVMKVLDPTDTLLLRVVEIERVEGGVRMTLSAELPDERELLVAEF